MANQPVDAVITWVDGGDPAHQAKLTKYLADQGIERPEAAAPTRFNQCGELDYCVRSLIRYAPWIRTIYIVTDSQTPALLNGKGLTSTCNTTFCDLSARSIDIKRSLDLTDKPQDVGETRVKIIDHREVFSGFEGNLPTFNSVAIESMLWRINGLSEKFIYVNDDCSLIRPVTYEDFFRGDDLVLRGEWKTMSDRKWSSIFKKRFGLISSSIDEHRQLQENSAKLAGYTQRFFHLPHAPFPLKKSTLEHFFANYPELLAINSHDRFRSRTQFWPISLAHHLEIQQKTAVFDNTLQTITVNPAFHSQKKIKLRLHHADINPRVVFVCMQSLDLATESTKNFLLEWLST